MHKNWKNIILPEYEVRKTRAQKSAFIDMLREHYGDRMTVEEEKGGLKSRNIVIGDPEQAKVVFTAHYDTCARMPFPNFITPCNFAVYLLYQLILTVVLLAPPMLLSVLAAVLCRPLPEFAGLLATEAALLLGLGAELWLMMAGPANRHTANDNTSGTVTVLTLADRLCDNPDAAFILFDHEEIGLLGSAAYAKKHPNVKKNGFVVNFDCVSDGDNLLAVFTKTAENNEIFEYMRTHAGEVMSGYGKIPVIVSSKKAFYPSDQAAFKNTVAAAALKKAPVIGLYMDKIHTPKDTEFDESNIEALVKLWENAVKEKETAN